MREINVSPFSQHEHLYAGVPRHMGLYCKIMVERLFHLTQRSAHSI